MNNNRKLTTDNDAGPSSSVMGVGYGYNSRGNMTSMTKNYLEPSISYGRLYELLHTTVGVMTDLAYDPTKNRLTSASGGYAFSYDYNDDGDATFFDDAGSQFDLQYDRLHKLTSFNIHEGASIAQFSYDGDGTRVTKTSAEGTIVYHHDNDGRVISETESNGNPISNLVYANGKMVAKLLPTIVYFYHTDSAGTPAAMTDPAGSAVWRADYLPFGEENLTSGALENDFRFVGKENDKETGLYYFGARYMEAMIGRFVSPDPVGAVYPRTSGINEKVIRNPQRVNLYAYGLNNPYRYIDPDGNEAYENVDTRGILNRTIRSINDPSNWLPFRPPIIYQGIDNNNNFERVQDAFKKAQEINQRPLNQRIRDIQNNQDKWERIGERKDPKQPPGGESRRELWQNKESGELIEKHELRQSKPPRQPHPHYKEPNKKEWGF